MWLRERADTGSGRAMAPIPFLNAVFKPRQPPRKAAQDTQLVLGQWAEIFANGSVTPLRGFVFSLRPGEVLFTFPDLARLPEGARGRARCGGSLRERQGSSHRPRGDLARGQRPAGHGGFSATGQGGKRAAPQLPTRQHAVARDLAAGEESTQAAGGKSDERARIHNLGAGGILVETSLPVVAGDGVDLVVPEPAKVTAAGPSRHVAGKVLRVEKSAERKRAARVASVEFSFASDDERDAWARLVLALQRKSK
jgi:hypothetical protein